MFKWPLKNIVSRMDLTKTNLLVHTRNLLHYKWIIYLIPPTIESIMDLWLPRVIEFNNKIKIF